QDRLITSQLLASCDRRAADEADLGNRGSAFTRPTPLPVLLSLRTSMRRQSIRRYARALQSARRSSRVPPPRGVQWRSRVGSKPSLLFVGLRSALRLLYPRGRRVRSAARSTADARIF